MLFSSSIKTAFAVLSLCATTVTSAPVTTLVSGKADTVTKALYAFLLKNYGSKTISGQQDQESLDWVTSNIGQTPAILGVDFMDYSPSRVAYGSSSNTVDQAIAWHNKGGIVTFVWHWGSPSGSKNTADQPWWSNFYTAATNFDLAAAMSNPNGNDYKLILRDIDAIATQLKRLQSAGVPVLWRPLHEAEGGWFWWGAKGSGPCKELWNLLFDRLNNYHGLTNLIWVWNSLSSSWYPGNSKVDIVSTDIYASSGDHSAQTNSYNTLKSLCGDTKIIALGEVGVIPDPQLTKSAGAMWAYWVTWNGNFIKDGSYNSRSFLQTTFASDLVLTLPEISGWKNGGGSGTTTTRTATTTTRPSTTTSRSSATTTAGGSCSGGVAKWGQCGGIGYTGSSVCACGSICTYSNAYYSQCI